MTPSLAAVALVAGLTAFLAARLAPYIAAPAARTFLARRVRPVAEIIAAVAATIWALLRLFAPQPPDTRIALAIVLAATAWALHSVIGDLAASWIVRLEGTVERDRSIRIPGLVDGRIRRVGYRSALVETASGDLVRVPLRYIAARAVTVADTAAGARAHTFTMEVSKRRPLALLLERIPVAVLTSPWSSTARQPEVRLKSETSSSWIIQVTTWALDPAFAPEIEAAARSALRGSRKIDAERESGSPTPPS